MAANDTNNAAGGTPAPKKPAVKVSVAAKGSGRGAKNAAPAPEGVEDDSKRMGSARRGILFILVVCVIYALYLVFSGQLGTFLNAMRGVDYLWVIAACFVYVIYYFLGVFAYVLAVAKDPKTPLGLRDLMSVEASGILPRRRFTAWRARASPWAAPAPCSTPASSSTSSRRPCSRP